MCRGWGCHQSLGWAGPGGEPSKWELVEKDYWLLFSCIVFVVELPFSSLLTQNQRAWVWATRSGCGLHGMGVGLWDG